MLLTDYFRPEHDAAWDIALASGVRHAVVRLPEDGKFDYADGAHWQTLVDRFLDFGVKPVAIEPMPNELHDHIKTGDALRDESIARVISMFPHMRRHGIDTICFNFMAHVGWTRTRSDIPERGGATVTEFDLADYTPTAAAITAEELWQNYEYFVRAAVPEAERYGIRLALHPDDPPLPRLGNVSRIMISRESIRHAIRDIVASPALGLTMCQANFFVMGEDLFDMIREFSDRIYMVHFRNTRGTPEHFRETYHDNGDIDMARLMRAYIQNGVSAPVRVDHVPTMPGETAGVAGYCALGRYFAIGYLKGILDACQGETREGSKL